MRPKERVRFALAYGQKDRLSVFALFMLELSDRLRNITCSDELDTGVYMGNDLVKDCVGLEKSFYLCDEPRYVCRCGNHVPQYV